ncbi:MAG: alpha/beta fold hydrolase, partial [Vicinamibacterales bacterium]
MSAIPPSWQPDTRVRFFVRAPWLLSPLFCVASLRMYPEIAAAAPDFTTGIVTAARIAFRALTHMCSPGRMARRARLVQCLPGASEDLKASGYLERVHVPTLVITGDPWLDRVVPVALTREYMRIWPHARAVT